MTDYSISAKLKVDSSDLTRVRRELWSLGQEFRGLSAGIKKGLGATLSGLTVNMRGMQSANRSATRSMEDDYKRLGRAALREMRMVDRATMASARKSSGNAAASVRAMLAAERGIDAQIAALAKPAKKEAAPEQDLGFSVFGGNLAAGVVLRVFDAATSALVGWTQGLVDSTRAMMDRQRELQLTRVGIASLYVAGGQDIGGAMGKSAGTLTTLRRQAAEGIGGLPDYAKAYQTLETPMVQAGRSEADLLKIVRLTIAAGGAMEGRLGIRTAPIDVLQALGRGATDAQTRILSNVIRGGGKSLDQFNQMETGQKIDFLMRALEKWEPAAKMMGKTIDSMEETIKDWRENVFGVAMSARAADRYSVSLERQIGLMKDNEGALTNYNSILGISFGVLADFKQSMDESRAAADVATATSKASVHQALRAAGGMEMLGEQINFTKEPLKNFYVGLTYATNALVSFGARTAASVALLYNSSRFFALLGGGTNQGDISGQLSRIWNYLPEMPNTGGFNMEADANGGVPTWGTTPDKLGASIAKGMQRNARRDRLDVRAKLDWGDPRQMAISLEKMIDEVAQRAYSIRVSADTLPAYPGG